MSINFAELTFDKTERPEVTVVREKQPNPFTPQVDAVWKAEQKSPDAKPTATFTLPMGEQLESGKFKNVESALRKLREAGSEVGCTVRTQVHLNIEGTKPKKGVATVVFWTAKKITRGASEGDTAEK